MQLTQIALYPIQMKLFNRFRTRNDVYGPMFSVLVLDGKIHFYLPSLSQYFPVINKLKIDFYFLPNIARLQLFPKTANCSLSTVFNTHVTGDVAILGVSDMGILIFIVIY